jgi:putative transposase
MQIGNQFRCYPTAAQAQILLQWIGCQRNIYNSKVCEDQYYRSFARKSLQHVGQYALIDQQYSQFKTVATPYLSEVPSQVLRNGAVLWKQAYGRYFSKLSSRPAKHHKHGKQSVWLTSELFNFKQVTDIETGETGYQLHIGTKKFPVGLLAFNAHRTFNIPASIHISIHAGRWHISFNYNTEIPEPTDKEIAEHLMQFTENELRTMAIGLDRGVILPLAGSDGQHFGFTDIQQQRLLKQEHHKKRWQHRQARRTKGSGGWIKAKIKVARYQRYGADVRKDVAHKTSYTLATDLRYQLFVFEALKVRNMTKKAKPKQDTQGRWIRNGAAAKSGLNKSILASTWGQTKVFLQYKARRQGKLVIEVSPQYSSQKCAACGYIHQDNRKSQSEFVCLSCGNQDHADLNAAKVIKQRGIKLLLNGLAKKEVKRCGIGKMPVKGVAADVTGQARTSGAKVGKVFAEPIVAMQSTLSKTKVIRGSGNATPFWSLTSETPSTRPLWL